MIYQSEIKNSIAVFDSGLGGLSVLCDLCKLPELANEKFFYFADSKNLPYGDKSAKFIFERILQIAVFLENLGFKALVIACNTATALAADEIRKIVKIPDNAGLKIPHMGWNNIELTKKSKILLHFNKFPPKKEFSSVFFRQTK